MTDIDALKRSEAVLQENEVRLRTLLDGLAGQVRESDGAHPALDIDADRAITGRKE